jgi:hypothetical protein
LKDSQGGSFFIHSHVFKEFMKGERYVFASNVFKVKQGKMDELRQLYIKVVIPAHKNH